MNFFIKRYVIEFSLVILASFSLWMTSVWYLDGIVPKVIGLSFFLLEFGYIPFLIRQDYQKVKTIYLDYRKMQSKEMTPEVFHKKLVIRVVDEIGIPEFIGEKIVDKVITKFSKQTA
jgi:hypothetical protein